MKEHDSSLVKLFELAKSARDLHSANQYSLCEDMLVRTWCHRMRPSDKQFVVPKPLRQKLISVAHDQISSTHPGVRKTLARLQHWFYWPTINSDVKTYCRSCEICQRLSKRGEWVKAP